MIWLLFIIKHFLCNLPLQRSFKCSNKVTWWSPSRLFHSGFHGAITLVILSFFAPDLALLLAVADFIIHYQTDYTRESFCEIYDLKPDNSNWFRYLLEIEQLVHYLTYASIIWVIN